MPSTRSLSAGTGSGSGAGSPGGGPTGGGATAGATGSGAGGRGGQRSTASWARKASFCATSCPSMSVGGSSRSVSETAVPSTLSKSESESSSPRRGIIRTKIVMATIAAATPMP
eukprot:10764277-Lingulodinium_polyedra.AAC.1